MQSTREGGGDVPRGRRRIARRRRRRPCLRPRPRRRAPSRRPRPGWGAPGPGRARPSGSGSAETCCLPWDSSAAAAASRWSRVTLAGLGRRDRCWGRGCRLGTAAGARDFFYFWFFFLPDGLWSVFRALHLWPVDLGRWDGMEAWAPHVRTRRSDS